MDTRPHTPQEIQRWALSRLPHEREVPPEIGERLLLRERNFGPAVPAVVTAVQDMTSPHDHWRRHGGLEATHGPGEPDPHVWEEELDAQGQPTGQMTLKDDPWPWVQVAVIRTAPDGSESLGSPRWTKEARVRGSAGWLREGSRAHAGNYESE